MGRRSCNNNVGGVIEDCQCGTNCCLQDCDRIREQSDNAFDAADENFCNALGDVKDALCELKQWAKCQCVGEELAEAADECEKANRRIKDCFNPRNRRVRSNSVCASVPATCNALRVKAAKANTRGAMLTNKANQLLCDVLGLLKEAKECFEEADVLGDLAEKCEKLEKRDLCDRDLCDKIKY